MKLFFAAATLLTLAACAVPDEAPAPGTHVSPVATPVVVAPTPAVQRVATARSSKATSPAQAPTAATEDTSMTVTDAPAYDAGGRDGDGVVVELY